MFAANDVALPLAVTQCVTAPHGTPMAPVSFVPQTSTNEDELALAFQIKPNDWFCRINHSKSSISLSEHELTTTCFSSIPKSLLGLRTLEMSF